VVGFYSLKDKEEFSDIKLKKVTILGMGYVGLTLAVALSDVGFAVNGYDVDEDLLGALRAGKSRFYEKGLEKYLDNVVGKGITFDSHLENVKGNVYIITVGTPIIKSTMKPNIKYAMKAAADIAQILDKGDLVILRSTVPVGFCRDIIPILEKGSKLKVGRDFYLAYAPERTTEGQALKELRSNPQIIGGYDEKSKELAARLFNSLTHSVIDVESLEAAEMCKLIDNTYRDHIFAFANQLAPLAEKIGVDLCRLIDAVNHGYSRNSVPRPSPGVGGACLSKDPYILGEVFRKHRLNPSLVLGARKVNEKGPILVRNKLKKLLSSVGKDIKKARILLVGLAFKGKPETSDLRDSTSVWFLDCLPSKTNVCAYDPIVPKREIEKLGIEAVSIEEGFKGADAVVFLNNHASYVDLNVFELAKTMHRPAVFIDTWH
ncbi:MAG: nucleotide sugar dehydrogenase, partial [Candidatus Heimdallarchaeota archaeon]|nr:nucleotide sugar dehydrogenase [Candidatus Heimdallarchaeota archaeon]